MRLIAQAGPTLTEEAADVEALWNVFVAIAAGVGALVAALLAWCIVRYRRRDDRLPRQLRHHWPTEIAYLVLPLLIVVGLFVGTFVTVRAIERPDDPDLVVDVVGWYRSTGAESMRRLLERGTHFDGVVAFNDLIALGAMRVMQEAGLRIPHDVAVIGFDDVDETRYTLPTLSTIDPGREEIVEVALRYLTERIDGSAAGLPARDHLTAFRVLQRESTTPE